MAIDGAVQRRVITIRLTRAPLGANVINPLINSNHSNPASMASMASMAATTANKFVCRNEATKKELQP